MGVSVFPPVAVGVGPAVVEASVFEGEPVESAVFVGVPVGVAVQDTAEGRSVTPNATQS